MRKWLNIILILSLVSGCGMTNNNNEAEEGAGNQQQIIHVKNSTIQNVDRKSGQEISQHLVDLATSIPNVNDATAVVLGNYALVGIDVKEDIERSQVGAIKYSVAESLKKDPYGARAVVIADPDMTARIREVANDIRDGKPVAGIMNELADISGRLMPEVPADLVDPNPREHTVDKAKNKLNETETKQLEKQQKKQSNHHLD
ncbi:YhcN/YlaJ family sporulation lipoprotein [Robertmurraya andreesenii]|uniref:YhcN/YlaJ family sporulation lipoprotein n=1 Tax=Anoxybacillus andreesenii TaxID=1325932 RepID=A0ABT9V4J7_9BACL|nr:YhcN/YlaJ family sporulation lipoprotein [Robertmurraya andreesenii]MDQ0155869.1 YhcN/YlaJ family sporulation lipoprotein [Robertmurraya andreesenii]